MAVILDGKKLSERILGELVQEIKNSGKKLKLAAVLVGDDKNSRIFLRQKEKACIRVGIDFELRNFSEDIGQEVLEKEIRKIILEENHGVIIQLPLPEHIDAQRALDLIPAAKDVDLLSRNSQSSPLLLPPVLAGILELFKEYKIEVQNKNVAVVGRGRLVGEPVAKWMQEHGAEVFVIDENTKNVPEFTRKADIVISGTGVSGLITGSILKDGTVVVDAAGDVDFKSAEPRASYITPVPGGVGPMTVAMLLRNLISLNNMS